MDIIWSVRNGLLMNRLLEKQLRQRSFCPEPNEPTRWKCVPFDEEIAPHRISDWAPFGWKDLDGRELMFMN